MPIIIYVPQDPTDLIMAGEEMRASVLDMNVSMQTAVQSVSITAWSTSIVTDEDHFAPMNDSIDGNRMAIRRAKSGELQMRSGAGIATPTGGWIYNNYAPLIGPCMFATNLFAISGVTKDSTGAALGNCRVIALETARLAVDGGLGVVGPDSPVVSETYSDGSGNYTLPVALNTAHQLTAYLPGSPNVAGITRDDVTPTHVG